MWTKNRHNPGFLIIFTIEALKKVISSTKSMNAHQSYTNLRRVLRGVIEYKYITCCSNACHCCSSTTLSFIFATLANWLFHFVSSTIFYVNNIYNFLYWYPLSSIILNDFNYLPRTSNSIALKHVLQIETSGKLYFEVRGRNYDGPHSFTLRSM